MGLTAEQAVALWTALAQLEKLRTASIYVSLPRSGGNLRVKELRYMHCPFFQNVSLLTQLR